MKSTLYVQSKETSNQAYLIYTSDASFSLLIFIREYSIGLKYLMKSINMIVRR